MKLSPEWEKLPQTQKEIILAFQKELPVPIGAIAKSFDIQIKVATLPTNISGEIKEEQRKVVIKVNRHDVKERQRFTVAHEIAHFLLHREYLKNGITDSVLYRSALSNDLEFQANRLAADIVMPIHLIKEWRNQHSDMPLEQQIEKLSIKSEVSSTAIKIRLGK